MKVVCNELPSFLCDTLVVEGIPLMVACNDLPSFPRGILEVGGTLLVVVCIGLPSSSLVEEDIPFFHGVQVVEGIPWMAACSEQVSPPHGILVEASILWMEACSGPPSSFHGTLVEASILWMAACSEHPSSHGALVEANIPVKVAGIYLPSSTDLLFQVSEVNRNCLASPVYCGVCSFLLAWAETHWESSISDAAVASFSAQRAGGCFAGLGILVRGPEQELSSPDLRGASAVCGSTRLCRWLRTLAAFCKGCVVESCTAVLAEGEGNTLWRGGTYGLARSSHLLRGPDEPWAGGTPDGEASSPGSWGGDSLFEEEACTKEEGAASSPALAACSAPEGGA